MSLEQGRECHFFGHVITTIGKPAQQLSVGQATDRPHIEECLDVLESGTLSIAHHRWSPPPICVAPGSVARAADGSDSFEIAESSLAADANGQPSALGLESIGMK